MAAEANAFPSRIVLDITDTLEAKRAAVRAYRSQFDGERLSPVEHVIRSIAGYEGAMAGYTYGEAYALPRPLGTSDLMAALGEWGPPPPFDPLAPPRANAVA